MGCCSTKESGPGVRKHEKYKEHCYRMVFPYEDNFDVETEMLTILPTGVIENTKIIAPEPEQGLLAFPWAQEVSTDVAQKICDKEESKWKGKKLAETPFVKKSGNRYCVVQIWPTKFNQEFKTSFAMTDHAPDLKRFDSGGVVDLRDCIKELFGEEAFKKVKIKYCHKERIYESPCYCGTTENLLEYFKRNPDAMEAVNIKNLEENGFVANGKDGRDHPIEKPFTMEPTTEYVIYKKFGWEEMGCCKLKAHFDKESEFLDSGTWLPLDCIINTPEQLST